MTVFSCLRERTESDTWRLKWNIKIKKKFYEQIIEKKTNKAKNLKCIEVLKSVEKEFVAPTQVQNYNDMKYTVCINSTICESY